MFWYIQQYDLFLVLNSAKVSPRSIEKLTGVLSSARTQFPNTNLGYSKFQELKNNYFYFR